MLKCPKCDGELLSSEGYDRCFSCGIDCEVQRFPALGRAPKVGKRAALITSDEEAGCFSHPDKQAIATCENCGRFLCSLCEVTSPEETVCFDCFSRASKESGNDSSEGERTLFDSIALALALYPLLFFYFTVFTAPIALFMCFRYWKHPLGLLRKSRIRFVIAGAFATLQVVGWIALLIFLATSFSEMSEV